MKFDVRDWKRTLLVIVSVCLMGFNLSFMNRTGWGLDPCSCMNMGISGKLGWMFGNWQALFNSFLLVFVFIFSRKLIGIGTFANMFLVGYCVDFFTWLENKLIPNVPWDKLSVKIAVGMPALAFFIIVCSTYMACDMGTAPYDALSQMLHDKITGNGKRKISFKVTRTAWDLSATLIGFILGGKPGIITVLMSLFLGTVINWMNSVMIRIGLVKAPTTEVTENAAEAASSETTESVAVAEEVITENE